MLAHAQDTSKTAPAKKEVRAAGIWYGTPDAPKKAAGALRLAAYNVENLFDAVDDPNLSGEFDDIKETTSTPRLEGIAKMIRALNADVLCLEEVESKECLVWFRDTYLKGMGYDHVASMDASYYRGVEQSVLSRIPIVSVSNCTGTDATISDMEVRRSDAAATALAGAWSPPQKPLPERFQRSPLRVDLKTKDGYELTVFVVHFKAGGVAFAHQRELEALQTEQFVADMLLTNADANVAVLGDFNGTPNDMCIKALRMSDRGLVSAYDWRFDPKAQREVYTTHASSRVLDYIIMTPGLAADCIDKSFFVLGTLHAPSDWDFNKADTIPPPAGYASDHCPIAIDLLTAIDKPASSFKRTEPLPAASTRAVSAPEGPRGLRLLDGVKASDADIALATKLVNAGWNYTMPKPKSKTAAWDNPNKQSTWFPGYWENASTKATSVAQPVESDGVKGSFVGDVAPAPKWIAGGPPNAPTIVEWLCSTSDGIEPK